jgi:preprotein translocase subunit SecA
MDLLKQEASLFSYASEDPLIDYISGGQKLFKQMMDGINRQFLSALFTRLEQQGLLK